MMSAGWADTTRSLRAHPGQPDCWVARAQRAYVETGVLSQSHATAKAL
ncbi:uncharacterized protein METZ01_LOCUS79381 [marine metagenome]|uniref:Uncharacterized protein n=1 Tax=marine metagenome TaxID=408172 RepID=A0A381UGQ7_9ZZZZ